MDVGNDCWTQSRGSVGKGEDGDICTANISLRGQPFISSDQLFSCRKAGPVSPDPLHFQERSEYAFI